MVGMSATQAFAVTPLHIALRRAHCAGWEPQQLECPRPRVGHRRDRCRGCASQIRKKVGINRAAPSHRFVHHWGESVSRQDIKSLECIHGAKHLLKRAAIGFKFITQLLAIANQSVTTARQTLPISLVSMTQAWLQHTITTVHLQHQAMNIGHQIFIHFM